MANVPGTKPSVVPVTRQTLEGRGATAGAESPNVG